ncbi:MAG: transposase [Bacteroidales bacterium]|nr:transposase [Bacteroidales bacterium]
MAIFQKSVIKKHLNNLDNDQVEKAYQKDKENYKFAKIEKIKELKEEEYQDGFLRDIFVDVLGYTLKPEDNYNLVREFKNQGDGKKADAAIVRREKTPLEDKAIVVIELKSTKTKDLKSITEQAFNYKNNQPDCKYIITSNFQKFRFYIDYAHEYEEFDLFNLQKERFELLYLLLNVNGVFSDFPLKLKEETKFHEQNISDKFYKEYSHFKRKLFKNLIKNHPDSDKLTLFKKSQKLLDRFIFILFTEDIGLLPPNSISRIIETYYKLEELDAYKPIYDIYKQYFGYMNIGRKGKKSTDNIPAYNGGLFLSDELLDNLKIDDGILIKDLLKLSEYDFNTEIDINILGHIFEHSLNAMEYSPLTNTSLADIPLISKRKKDGIFYTPKYITQYIIENTIGSLCYEKRKELEIEEIEFEGTYRRNKANEHVSSLSAKGKKLFQKLNNYKDWLLSLKIVDPACGSGAFLNQALNFLIEEHKNIDDIIAELTNSSLRLFDTDKAILENNLYGVDINEESVEIAKLSLWLRTAQKGRKLSILSNNIKCGNSLIDDPNVAGDKAFSWQNEFPDVFRKKEKKMWHITTATHNSRYSQRMFDNYVKTGKPVWLLEKEEIIVTQTIAEIAEKDDLNIIAYNICGDHVHILLVCEEQELPKIVQKLKSMSARACNITMGRTIAEGELSPQKKSEQAETTTEHAPMSAAHSVPQNIGACSDTKNTPVTRKRGKTQHHLWTQKFGQKEITSNEQLENTINYIKNNRRKHQLSENKELETIIDKLGCSRQYAFRTEYDGGFDVVIGNPLYGAKITKKDLTFILSKQGKDILKREKLPL